MRATIPLSKDLNETNRRMGSSEEEGGDRVCEQQTQKGGWAGRSASSMLRWTD